MEGGTNRRRLRFLPGHAAKNLAHERLGVRAAVSAHDFERKHHPLKLMKVCEASSALFNRHVVKEREHKVIKLRGEL